MKRTKVSKKQGKLVVPPKKQSILTTPSKKQIKKSLADYPVKMLVTILEIKWTENREAQQKSMIERKQLQQQIVERQHSLERQQSLERQLKRVQEQKLQEQKLQEHKLQEQNKLDKQLERDYQQQEKEQQLIKDCYGVLITCIIKMYKQTHLKEKHVLLEIDKHMIKESLASIQLDSITVLKGLKNLDSTNKRKELLESFVHLVETEINKSYLTK